MQIEKRLKNHYIRWNINLNYEEEFLRFKNRLITVIDTVLGDYLTKNLDVDNSFSKISNLHKAHEPQVRKSQPRYTTPVVDPYLRTMINAEIAASQPISYTEKGFGDTSVYKKIAACETLQELATALQILFWVLEAEGFETQRMASEIVKEIRRLSVLSPNASFAVHKRGKQFIVYPSGDPFLDRGVIDFTLAGLEVYPEAAEPFGKALEMYLRRETSQYRNLLDNLRFALEQLLKKILGNQKSLENQKSQLLPWLKEKGLHSQVVNLYERLLATYQDYQNSAVKHNEAFSVDEVEFMIYLTGSFMRLLLQFASREN